jgi:glutamine cyclotransferase
MRLYFLIILISIFSACNGTNGKSNNANKTNTPSAAAPVYTYEIVNTYRHDSDSFTQGLVVNNGFFYESAGQEGESDVRKVEIATGKILEKKELGGDFFAEGLTILNDKIYQLTWRDHKVFVYDMNFNLLKEFNYLGEGWGLTHDGTNLILSDGTHLIKVIDPETFKTIRTIAVLQDNGKPLFLLNELEYVKGEIWANIWHSEEPQTRTTQGIFPNLSKPNYIARIDPQSGKILGWIDLAGISPDDFEPNNEDKSENTLNGIAYDAAADRIFVTGKKWKKLFEIKIKPKQ